jgi:urease accessory protein
MAMLPQSPNQLPDYPITQLPDSRAPQVIGRSARLELRFERRGDRTILAHSYAEPPFRIGRAFDLDGAAYVILVTSGPGIFGGDSLRQSVHVGPGARVVLTSQSALQVHPASPARPAAPALLHHRYLVDEDAELQCQWDPVIPFAGSRLDQRFDIQIADSSRLYWTDALMAGRVSRGECWEFASLAHELRLRVGSAVAYLERYRVNPADRGIARQWMAGAATYFATVLVRHPAATPEAAEALYRHMTHTAGVNAGVDLVEPGLVAGRLMDTNGASFGRARASYRTFALESIFGGLERVPRK